ncbi:MAG: FHA domain-containing protein [Actinomycetota bacterium]|nr:MAG: FHA domain-containing protein [Actinomycetota bacterium]
MSELALTLLRLGFLAALWLAVLLTIGVLRRDLRMPREARAAVAAARPPRPAKPPRSKRGRPSSLVVTEGPLTGTVIPLGAVAVTIGRAPDSTLVLDDDYASSRHARLSAVDGQWVVEDLGSTNGTWIDRSRITAPTVLPVDAPLRVGRTTLQLRK